MNVRDDCPEVVSDTDRAEKYYDGQAEKLDLGRDCWII